MRHQKCINPSKVDEIMLSSQEVAAIKPCLGDLPFQQDVQVLVLEVMQQQQHKFVLQYNYWLHMLKLQT